MRRVLNMERDPARIELMLPHMARAIRKVQGSPQGTLKCSGCGATNASNNRQRTMFPDSDNMAVLCPTCQDEADKHWDDLWEEYYSMIYG